MGRLQASAEHRGVGGGNLWMFRAPTLRNCERQVNQGVGVDTAHIADPFAMNGTALLGAPDTTPSTCAAQRSNAVRRSGRSWLLS